MRTNGIVIGLMGIVLAAIFFSYLFIYTPKPSDNYPSDIGIKQNLLTGKLYIYDREKHAWAEYVRLN